MEHSSVSRAFLGIATQRTSLLLQLYFVGGWRPGKLEAQLVWLRLIRTDPIKQLHVATVKIFLMDTSRPQVADDLESKRSDREALRISHCWAVNRPG